MVRINFTNGALNRLNARFGIKNDKK